jgi:YVTN family beta-propeller protein
MTYDAVDGYVLLFGGESNQGLLGDTWKFSAGVWTNMTTTAGPSPRVVSTMAYDDKDGYAVLFGGCKLVNSSNGNCLSFFADTWKFSGGVWTNITSVSGPSRRLAAAITYDSADGFLLLFGGAGSNVAFGDTWKFQSGTWTNITSASGPSKRSATMAYDASDGFTLLFGGNSFVNNGVLGDTWVFKAGSWTNITSGTGPSARYGSMVYDGADGYIVLFGGLGAAGFSRALGDTWKFSQSTSSVIADVPVGTSPWGVAYDSRNGYVYVTNEIGSVSVISGTTVIATVTVGGGPLGVAFDSRNGGIYVANHASNSVSVINETSVVATVSVGGQPISVGYDSGNGGIYVANSLDGTVSVINGTAVVATITVGFHPWGVGYDNGNGYIYESNTGSGTISVINGLSVIDTITVGTLPAGVAYDSATGNVFVTNSGSNSVSVISGATNTVVATVPVGMNPNGVGFAADNGFLYVTNQNSNTTGVVSGTTLIDTVPVGKGPVGVAYDAGNQFVYVANVFSNTVSVISTPVTVSVWTNITSTTGPSPRYGASLTYDAADGYVVLFGGSQGAGGANALADTWKFKAGTWTQLSPSISPKPRDLATMVYDAADGYVLLFGGRNSSTFVFGDTWEFRAGLWTPLSPSNSPTGRTDASAAYDPTTRSVLLFGGFTGTALPSDTWEFQAGAWTQVSPSTSPAGRLDGAMTYDDSDGYALLFGGYSGVGFLSDTWKFNSGTWTQITTTGTPSARDTSVSYDAADGYVILFGGLNSTSSFTSHNVFGDTWTYHAGVWTMLFPSVSPPRRFVASMTYDPADSYALLFGGSGGTTLYNDDWKFSAISGLPPFDYSLFNNSPVTIPSGTSNVVSITASLTAGTAQPVILACTGLPAGITCGGFSPNPLTPTSGGAGSDLTINIGSSVAAETYMFTVAGSPAGATLSGASTTVTVVVPSIKDNTLTSLGSVSCTIQSGASSCNAAVTVTVTDTTTMSNVPGGAVTFNFMAGTTGGSLSSGSCMLTAGTCSVTFTGTMAGTGSVSAQYGGDASHSSSTSNVLIIHVTVATVPFDYSLSVNPTSASIVQGSATSAIVTATLTSGTGQQIGLVVVSITPYPAVCQSNTSPCGSLTFAPASITPTAQGATSTMTIRTTAILPPGTYTVTIQGSPAGQSSSTATFTITVAAPSTSTVSCGHNESCGVVSNATLSNVKIAGNTLHIEADGTPGAHGYANVTVPKSDIPNIDDMHVFVDNSKLNSGVTITSNSTAYFIYFTFTFHSPVKIDIQLSAPQQTPNAPTILGIDQTLFYEIIGGVIAAIVIVSAVVVVARRRKTKTPA